MLHFAARRVAHLALGLVGAMFIAALVSALAVPGARGLGPFLGAALMRFASFVRLDFGHSAISGLPALSELGQRLPPTLALLGAGGVMAFVTGIPLGLIFSVGPARRVAAPLAQLVTALPVFCAGLALAYGAVHLLHWPVSINRPAGPSIFGEAYRIAVPPVLMVGLAGAGAVQLALRRAALQNSGEAFRTGLRRLGLTAFEIERIYIVPQVLAGLAASTGDIMLALLSAAVVAEWVFHRPGAADLFVKSVALEDWNMAAIILAVFASVTLIADFLGRILGRVLASEGKP